MTSPSDSAMNRMFNMSMMNPRMQQGVRGGTVSPTGQMVMPPTPTPTLKPTNTIFDQSQQPVLGNIARPPMPQQQQMPTQEEDINRLRLPNQMISPSPEMMAKLLAQIMFPSVGNRR